jgi:type IV secretory pathway VirB10-like protein
MSSPSGWLRPSSFNGEPNWAPACVKVVWSASQIHFSVARPRRHDSLRGWFHPIDFSNLPNLFSQIAHARLANHVPLDCLLVPKRQYQAPTGDLDCSTRVGKTMNRCVLPFVMSALIGLGNLPIAFAASSEPQLNFKIYSPDSSPSTEQPKDETPATGTYTPPTAAETTPAPEASAETAPAPQASADTAPAPQASAEAPAPQDAPATPEMKTSDATDAGTTEAPAPAVKATAPAPTADASTAAEDTKNGALQAETPTEAPVSNAAPAAPATATSDQAPAAADTQASSSMSGEAATTTAESGAAESTEKTDKTASSKTLQGYIRVVPQGTKIPIIMDTAVDSDTSQEGDEFTARTSEDLNIDGAIAVPAGSIIKGRIAQMNAPKHMDRSGSVALKFDTVTTPDNRQIPLVANLVAHGGVVHARRGLKDIAIDSSTVLIPTLVGGLIGVVAGKSSSTSTTTTTSSNSITKPEAAAIGVAVGVAVGVAILLAKKGKKVDVRPGDELKIQLSEDLRMPMM